MADVVTLSISRSLICKLTFQGQLMSKSKYNFSLELSGQPDPITGFCVSLVDLEDSLESFLQILERDGVSGQALALETMGYLIQNYILTQKTSLAKNLYRLRVYSDALMVGCEFKFQTLSTRSENLYLYGCKGSDFSAIFQVVGDFENVASDPLIEKLRSISRSDEWSGVLKKLISFGEFSKIYQVDLELDELHLKLSGPEFEEYIR